MSSGIFPIFTNLISAGKVLELAKYTKELSKLFSSSENILLICHLNPDGDAIGSQLALYHYLREKNRKVEMISPNYLQEFLKWINGADRINIFIRDREKCKKLIEKADLILMLDFNQPSRMGEAENLVMASGARKVIIDHHLDLDKFADLTISDPSKCSTAELIHELIMLINGGPFLHKDFAEAIYIGIITDTGNFEHGTYNSNTFRIVADLVETGIETSNIIDRIYNNFSTDRMRLLGFALNKKMVVIPEFRTAYISLTRDELNTYYHVKGDTEGFVNLPLSIRGIQFSALFVEKDGFVKISFRSKGNFPVNEFAAKYFSGGGHLNASGGEYPGTLENTVTYFLQILKENAGRLNDENS